MSIGNNSKRHHPIFNITIFRKKRKHPLYGWSIPMNTDGDVFAPGAFKPITGPASDAVMAAADQVLDALGRFRCQGCGGVFDKAFTNEVSKRTWPISVLVCDKCSNEIMKSFAPMPAYPAGSPHPPRFGKGYHYAPGGHYDNEGKFVIDEISIVPGKASDPAYNVCFKVDPSDLSYWKDIITIQDEINNMMVEAIGKEQEAMIASAFMKTTGDVLTKENAHRITEQDGGDFGMHGCTKYYIDGNPVFMLMPVTYSTVEEDNNFKIVSKRSIQWL